MKSGITGSEEAIIFMSQQLAKLGYKVMVFGTPPKNSLYSLPEANPRYVELDFDDSTKFDIAIAWRTPEAADWLKKRARFVYCDPAYRL